MTHRTAMRRRVVLATIGAATFALVLLFGLLVARTTSWSDAEMSLVIAVNATNAPPLDAVAYTINTVLGPVGAVIVSIVVVAVMWAVSRSPALAVRMTLLIAASWASAEVMKSLVRRARPDRALLPFPSTVDPHSFSYPSGHTAFAVAITLAIVLVLAPGRARRIAVVVMVAVVVVTAWSRVYLGVHYPTDTLASMLIVPGIMLALNVLLPASRPFRRAIAHPSR